MRFSAIAQGARATTVVKLPWPGRDEPVDVLVRILSGDERATAVAEGRAYAKGKGIAEPKDDDEVFSFGVQANTVLLACRDADKPTDPFFETISQVVDGVDPERVAFLYAHWQVHQDRHAPQQLTLSTEEFAAKMIEIAGSEDPGPFLSMRLATVWSCMRIMANLLVSSSTAKSPFGSLSELYTSIASSGAINKPPQAASA